jgi:hypothetical protein
MNNDQVLTKSSDDKAMPLGTLTGLFRAQDNATSAIALLEKRGYNQDEVSVLMSEDTRKRFEAEAKAKHSLSEKASEGIGVGSVLGGVAGAIVAGVIAVAAPIVIPGIGLIISGPIVAALAGAGAGGLTGGLIGGLVGAGIPEEHAKIYDLGLRAGGVLITVQPRDIKEANEILQEWAKLHVEDVRS